MGCKLECGEIEIGLTQHMKHSTLSLLIFLVVAAVARGEDFKTSDGMEYKDVKFLRAEGTRAVIQCDAGVVRIDVALLPQAFRDRHGLVTRAEIEAAQAKVAAAQEEGRARAALQQAKAEEKRAEAAAAALASADIGDAPTVQPTRAPGQVTRYLKTALKDPDSLEYTMVQAPVRAMYQGQPCWQIDLRYRAKNSFGGFAMNEARAYLVKGSLVALEQESERARNEGGDVVVVPTANGVQVRRLPRGVGYRQSVGGNVGK